MSHGDGSVTITELLVGLDVVDEDEKVLLVLLVVDLGLGGLAACHVDGVVGEGLCEVVACEGRTRACVLGCLVELGGSWI